MARRRTQQLDPNGKSMLDNALVVAFARVFMPAAITVIGYFMTTTLGELKTNVKEGNERVWLAVGKLNELVHTQQTDLAVVKTKLDATSKAVDDFSSVINRAHPPK
jgi:hypothetical protein